METEIITAADAYKIIDTEATRLVTEGKADTYAGAVVQLSEKRPGLFASHFRLSGYRRNPQDALREYNQSFGDE